MKRPVKPGQVYEDCSYHPVVCTGAVPVRWPGSPWWRRLLRIADDWDIEGVSLLDASSPRSCSAVHCRIPRMGWDTALAVRKNWLRERADITSGGWAPGAYGPSLQGGVYGHPDPHEGTAE